MADQLHPEEDATDRAPAVVEDETSPMMQGEQWLAALQQYDSAAWDDLFNRFIDRLSQDIKKSLNKFYLPPSSTDDVIQDTLCTAMDLIHDFTWESEEKLYHWLRSIAYYTVRSLNHKEKPWVSMDEMDDQEDGGSLLDTFLRVHGLFTDSPEYAFDLRNSIEMIHRAMGALNERDQEIFARWLFGSEKPRHIAEDYDLTPEYISTIVNRAKKTILRYIKR